MLGFVPKRGLEISRTALAAGFLAKPGASALRLIVLGQSLVLVHFVAVVSGQGVGRDRLQSAPPLAQPGVNARVTPSPQYAPSWNPQPNPWRLGVEIQNLDTGVLVTDVDRDLPADRAGIEEDDIIVCVGGYQVGYVGGQLFDLGDEIRRRVDSNGRVDFLVLDHRRNRLINLPIELMQQNARSITGQATYRERVALSNQATLTVRLRDVTYPQWQNVVVAQQVVRVGGQPPIRFAIDIDRQAVYPDHRYALDAWIADQNRLIFQTAAQVPIELSGNMRPVELTLTRVGSQPPSNPYLAGQLDQLQTWYRNYLKREPTPQELAAWQTHLEQGRTPQEILSYILGSSEYYDRLGNQRDVYLRELYRNLTGKEPTAADLAKLQQQLQVNQGSRTQVARELIKNQPNPPY
jgi:uncharacterized lipoprotein YbaY